MQNEEVIALNVEAPVGVSRSMLELQSNPFTMAAYEILAEGGLKEISIDEALANAKTIPATATATTTTASPQGSPKSDIIPTAESKEISKDRNFWIDVLIRSDASEVLPQLQEKIFNKLKLPPLLVRHLRDSEQFQTPQVLTLIDSAFIVMRILSRDENSEDIRHTAGLCLYNVFITVTSTDVVTHHHKTADRSIVQKDTMAEIAERDLLEATVSGATAMWLASHLGRTAAATRKLRLHIIDLCDDDIATIKLSKLVLLKDTLLRLSAVAEEQHECLQNVVGGDLLTDALTFDGDLIKGLLGVNMAMAASTERMIFRLEKRVSDLRSEYDGHQQSLINRRLNVLTVLSAIFLPLTLMAGVWGMNFTNMPELQREYAYYYAIGSMISVAIILLLLFWRLGWFS